MAGLGTIMDLNGTTIFVADSGEPSLPVLLCLHSLWFDHSMFDRLMVEAKGCYRVVRPDFRGQGRSGRPAGRAIAIETCAGDVAAVCDTLALRDIHLIGQSMGGDVAFQLMLRRPELARSLTLMGSSARAEPEDQRLWAEKWIAESRTLGIAGERTGFLMEALFGRTTLADPSKQPMLRHWRAFMERVGVSGLAPMIGVVERPGVLHALPSIDAPTLVLSGMEDRVRPPSWSEEVVAHMPNATLVRLGACGHSPILEVPDQVITLLFAHVDHAEAAGANA
ncbi:MULTISPECIES: alpha/beta fold hydrolase [Sphingobium]|uniref:alpha/beta fold hydrolase n=1 Tax=Sphingobium TaxID=165695 RepID=UPI00159C5EC7|nr:alpha/beta hydrolase [Sphingobium sp. 15-1]